MIAYLIFMNKKSSTKQKTPCGVFCGTYVVYDKCEYNLTLTNRV